MAASSTITNSGQGSVLGHPENSCFEFECSWQDGATAGTIPDATTPTNSVTGGIFDGISVVSGSTPFNSITVTVKNSRGATLASGTVTASGGIDVIPARSFVGALTVSHSGNTTANANGKTYLHIAA